MSNFSIFINGIIKENPVLVLLLGLCPVLAVTTNATNAVGLGAATTFVLLGSNIMISLLRKVTPSKVRIPCYIVIIAGFVSLVQMIVEAYAYELHISLGIFLPLIACNCLVFARAEIFAKYNTPFKSIIDALGMGLGFTLAVFIIAAIREIFGTGTLFGYELPVLANYNISIMTLAPGGFVVLGLVIAAVNKISKGTALKTKEINCKNCPSAITCGKRGHK